MARCTYGGLANVRRSEIVLKTVESGNVKREQSNNSDGGRAVRHDGATKARIPRIGVEHVEHFVEHLHGPEEIYYAEDELVVLCLVRDGRPYVKSFVEHYTSLGVKHLVFLDNGSTDGTVEALKQYNNATVLRAELPYKHNEYLMRQYLVARFGKDRWSLCADMDELFDYPYSDIVGLGSLLRYLNGKSYNAVAAQALDMFPEKPLSGASPASEPDTPLKELHRFYDVSRLTRKPIKEIPDLLLDNTLESGEVERLSGGIREMVFGFAPSLTVFPLVFFDDGVKLMQSGRHRVNNARIADVTCVLFHYKFVEHFREQVVRNVQEENHFKDSFEYKKYLEVLDENPTLQVKQETSKEIGGANELLEDRFLVVSDDYVDWANAEEEKSVFRTLAEPLRGEQGGLAQAFLESRRRERAQILKTQRLKQEILRLEGRLRNQDRRVQRLKEDRRNLKRHIRGLERMRYSRTRVLAETLRRIKARMLSLGKSPS